jgi:hypothetical protein
MIGIAKRSSMHYPKNENTSDGAATDAKRNVALE